MQSQDNKGFDPNEINLLKEECKQIGLPFIYIEDEEDNLVQKDELAHVQFVGKYKGQEVIYDTIIYTLRLHHSSLVYEKALEQVQKTMPHYLPFDERPTNYKISEADEQEAEELMTDIIDLIEDEQEIKVKEHLEIEPDFEYGISLDACLNVESLTDKIITNFIREFNAGTLQLDPTLYSFTSMEEDDDTQA